MSEEERDPQAAITLKAAGLTVISVIVSVGTTVGFGLTAPWWAASSPASARRSA